MKCLSIFAEQLKERQLFHSTYKLYISALTLELFHLLFMCVGFGNYANNGLEGPLHGFKTFGNCLRYHFAFNIRFKTNLDFLV